MAKCSGSETSSRLVTRSAHVAHNFEVTGFSLLDGIGAETYVSSKIFSAGGHDWTIKVYPDGYYKEDKAAYVSVLLCLVGGAVGAKATVTYAFDVLEKDDRMPKLSPDINHMLSDAFEPGVHDLGGFPRFVRKSKLEPLLRLNGTDVAFHVDGRLFHAHKCVLAARSPVFDAELFGLMKEKDTEPIKVDGMEACIFEELLHFIYTDRMSDKFDGSDRDLATQHLLVAADRYGLDRLMLMCEAKLCHGIDAQTVATTLALADQHSCVHLKDACLTFVASGDALGDVMKTDGFKHLVESCPFVMVEILDKIAKSKSQ
nr:unnamed protein product [Digitaria exilis]